MLPRTVVVNRPDNTELLLCSQDPTPLPYLQHTDKYSFDINLSVAIQRTTVTVIAQCSSLYPSSPLLACTHIAEGGSGRVVSNSNLKVRCVWVWVVVFHPLSPTYLISPACSII
jgi:hypothetical protein